MKWTKVSQYCIKSGPYTISKFSLGGMQLFQVYHGDTLIGDAPDGNKARKLAEKHADKQEVTA